MSKHKHEPHGPAKQPPDSDISDTPPPEPVDDWPAEPFTAAKWGMAAGAILSVLYVNYNSITGFGITFYPGDAGIPIVLSTVGGAVAGFILGWVWYFVRRYIDD